MTEQKPEARKGETFRRFIWSLAILIVFTIACFSTVLTTRAKDVIPGTTGTSFQDILREHRFIQAGDRLDKCGVCHDDINLATGTGALKPQVNPFGLAVVAVYVAPTSDTRPNRVAALNSALAAIASETDPGQDEDSDNDGYTNFEEIMAKTYPGCGTADASKAWCSTNSNENVPATPSINLTMDNVSRGEFNDPVGVGESVDVVFNVTNQGPIPLLRGNVQTAGASSLTCPTNQTLSYNLRSNAAETTTFSCRLTVNSELKTQPLNLSASGVTRERFKNPAKGYIATDTLAVDFIVADIEAAATVNQTIVGNNGNTALNIDITNNGEAPLTDIKVEVLRNGQIFAPCTETRNVTLAPNGMIPTISCVITNILVAEKVDVLVSGQYAPGKRVTFQPAATTIQVEGIAIQLSTDITATVRGETIPYSATITNTSSAVDSTGDPVGAAVENILAPPDCNAILLTLPAGESDEIACTVQATLGAGDLFTHSIAITGTINGRDVTDRDEFSVAVEERAPSINVDIVPATQHALPGEQVTIDFEIQNSGNVALSAVNLTVVQAPQCNRTVTTLATKSHISQLCQVTIDENLIEVINGKPVYSIVAFATGTDDVDQVEVPLPKAVSVTLNASQQLYLPVIYSDPPSFIDLIVESITVDERGVEVVIKNIGDANLQGTGYWIDLYFNPSRAPTGVNQLARDWGDAGVVWGIPADAAALAPGQTRTLYVADPFYVDELSFIPRNLDPGSKIYVQVDSANQATEYGAIWERHEIWGDAYNNISAITLFEVVNTDNWPEIEAAQASEIRRAYRHLWLQVPRESEERRNGQP